MGETNEDVADISQHWVWWKVDLVQASECFIPLINMLNFLQSQRQNYIGIFFPVKNEWSEVHI